MYAAQANGRGGIRACDSSLDEGRILRHQIGREIASGLGRNECDGVCQPLADAQDFPAVGIEALVRWPGRPAAPSTPTKSSALPKAAGSFRRPACICPGGRAARHKTSKACAPASMSHRPRSAIPTACDRSGACWTPGGLAPERLRLEITQRHLIDDPERARRATGVGFAPDNFGTGFTCVKTDRSLTKRLRTEHKAGHLICGLVDLAKGLDLRVVAEGARDERLAQMLKPAGCNEHQGYHFGRPACLAQALNMAAPPETGNRVGLILPAGVDAGLLRQFAGAAACLVLGVEILAGTGTGHAWTSNGRSPGTSS